MISGLSPAQNYAPRPSHEQVLRVRPSSKGRWKARGHPFLLRRMLDLPSATAWLQSMRCFPTDKPFVKTRRRQQCRQRRNLARDQAVPSSPQASGREASAEHFLRRVRERPHRPYAELLSSGQTHGSAFRVTPSSATSGGAAIGQSRQALPPRRPTNSELWERYWRHTLGTHLQGIPVVSTFRSLTVLSAARRSAAASGPCNSSPRAA